MPTRDQLRPGVRDSRDACGDGGKQFYEIVSSLARRGWSDVAILRGSCGRTPDLCAST